MVEYQRSMNSRNTQVTIRKQMKNKTVPLFLLAALFSVDARAGDISVSGFGTIGYAVSDQPYTYQRFINDSGTFDRDSLLALQVDAELNNQWSATVQGKIAPSLNSDSEWDPTVAWAFIAYRPNNDWLFRVGKLRIPLYLHSENMDVGTTYDFVRLPMEMYSLAPTTDFTGISVCKNWNLDTTDIILDAYWGRAHGYWRSFMRDDLSAIGGFDRGAVFVGGTTEATGLALTAKGQKYRVRAGMHMTTTEADNGPMYGDLYYGNISPVPGITINGYLPQGPVIDEIRSPIFTIGAEIALGDGFHVTGEVARRPILNNETGPDSTGGYLALLKEAGPWTPYVSIARLKSSSAPFQRYQAANNNIISAADLAILGPSASSLAAALTASQRAIADVIVAYDQTTFALGTSYTLSPKQKLKFEWAQTHTGAMSSMIDAPPGGDSGDQTINIFSISYNFVF